MTRRTMTISKRGDDARFFVWLKTNGRWHPQIWYGDQLKGSGQFQRGPVGTGDLKFCEPLKSDDIRELDELATDFNLMPDELRKECLDVANVDFIIPVCQCDYPLIKCNHHGCRCTLCGLPENLETRAKLLGVK